MTLFVTTTSVTLPMANSRLHILGLRQKLISEKEFLRSLITLPVQKRRRALKNANKKQQRLLQCLLASFVRGDIEISPRTYAYLKRARKLTVLVENFETLKTDVNLMDKLLQLSSVLPTLLKYVVKHKSVKSKQE